VSSEIDVIMGWDDEGIDETIRFTGKLPNFYPFDTTNIHCNLSDGMIIKYDENSHNETGVIAIFKTNAKFGGPTVYEPTYPLFFPIQNNKFHNVKVSITDEKDNIIDFGGSTVTVILQVK
jgi:hypothetical protein